MLPNSSLRQHYDFSETGAQPIDVFCVIAAAFPRPESLRVVPQRLRQVGQSTFHCIAVAFSRV